MEDDLAVGGRLKNRAVGFQFRAEPACVDQIPVMSDRNLATPGFHRDRLGVLDRARAGRGVANMPDRPGSGEIF